MILVNVITVTTLNASIQNLESFTKSQENFQAMETGKMIVEIRKSKWSMDFRMKMELWMIYTFC